MLADAGWDVCLLESTDIVGGAVRSAELHPGFTSRPVQRVLPARRRPRRCCARWSSSGTGCAGRTPPSVLAHPPRPDGGPAAVLHRDRERHRGRARRARPAGRRRVAAAVRAVGPDRRAGAAHAVHRFPAGARAGALLRRIGTADALRLARFLLLPARRMAEELFAAEAGAAAAGRQRRARRRPTGRPGQRRLRLAAGHARASSTATRCRWAAAGELAAALARRAAAAGAQTAAPGSTSSGSRCAAAARVAVHTAAGLTVRARRAVIADVSAPVLYQRAAAGRSAARRGCTTTSTGSRGTPRSSRSTGRCDGPIPWRSPGVAGAGHRAPRGGRARADPLVGRLESRTLPDSPFLLFGQMTTADPTRSPAGTESAWAYTHLPRGVSDEEAADELAERVDAVVERFAPGFGARVLHRHVQGPADLQAADPNLVHGAVERRHRAAVPAAGVPPGARAGPGRDRRRGALPGQRLRAPGRRACTGCAGGSPRGRRSASTAGCGRLRRRVTSAALELIYRDAAAPERAR